MNYTEIFHEVVSIMEKDSATCKDMEYVLEQISTTRGN